MVPISRLADLIAYLHSFLATLYSNVSGFNALSKAGREIYTLSDISLRQSIIG
jgi:hypothetical protein